MAKLTAALVVAAAALVLASPGRAAAPRYIMVTGPGLARPILLDDWWQNLDFLVSVSQAPRATGITARSLRPRPRYRLWLFWTLPADPPTNPRQADQTGRFFPACGSRPALIDLLVNGERVLRFAPRDVLRILAAHRVPTRRCSRPR